MPIIRDESTSCDLSEQGLSPEPASIVIFGATGDLTHRKIVPALYNLERNGILPPETRIIGFARRSLSGPEFRDGLRESCSRFSHTQPLDEAAWARLAERMSYIEGDLEDPMAYARLALHLAGAGMPPNALFYLAISPEQFGSVARYLDSAGLGTAGHDLGNSRFRRLVVEKPFGRDRESARLLTKTLHECFAERDIFRIDHYLGKETVQNLLYFRFANSIFEPLWSRNHIESVEIDVLESGGIGTRGGYYDHAGASRDMIQNHLVQLLCLTAMEPPATLAPESIREEKVKVLKAIPDYQSSELISRSVRGQYTAGKGIDGKPILDYRSEPKVAPDSRTETFVGLNIEVENWRFAGVPFILRTGKALNRQESVIRVTFKRPPATLFAGFCGDLLAPNVLTIRIQPDEGMFLGFNTKVPGAARITANDLHFAYREATGDYFPEAYERLIADALSGDSTLFLRSDETDEAWRLVDSLEHAWSMDGLSPLASYEAGGSGPPIPEAWFRSGGRA
jgi:glucose-6-phosphate 1-dehydrogenase